MADKIKLTNNVIVDRGSIGAIDYGNKLSRTSLSSTGFTMETDGYIVFEIYHNNATHTGFSVDNHSAMWVDSCYGGLTRQYYAPVFCRKGSVIKLENHYDGDRWINIYGTK